MVLAAEASPAVTAAVLLWVAFGLYRAVRTAMNGRWVLFSLGFMFGGLFWIVGAFSGAEADSISMKRYEKRFRKGGQAPRVVLKQRPADGRCPQCGKRDQWGDRCGICQVYLGGPISPPPSF